MPRCGTVPGDAVPRVARPRRLGPGQLGRAQRRGLSTTVPGLLQLRRGSRSRLLRPGVGRGAAGAQRLHTRTVSGGRRGGRWERGAAPAAQRLRSSAAPLHGARLVPLLEVENRSCCWEKRWAALGLAASRVVGLSREMESVRPKSRQPSRIGLTKSFNLVLLCRSAPTGLLLSDWNPSRRSPAVLIVKDAVGPCLFFFFPYLQRKNGVPSR